MAYAERFSWAVLPLHEAISRGGCSCSKGAECQNAGKHPRIKAWTDQASTDPQSIHDWWQKWPSANVGVATGLKSGLVVVDVDPRHGGDDSLLALIQQHGALPETVEAITGSGGRHLFFQHPGGAPMRNMAGTLLGPGLDFRADGGMVVVAPSRHASGTTYCWEASSRPGEVPLAPLPDWLEVLLRGQETRRAEASAGKAPALPDVIESGQRNSLLTSLAGSMRRRGASEEAIRAALAAENTRCRPPLEDAEIDQIARSAASWSPAGDGASPARERQSPVPTFRFLTPREVIEIPPVEMLPDGWVARGGFTMLCGGSGTLKSFVALRWSLADAQRGLRVVYVVGEGLGGWGQRLRAAEEGYEAVLPSTLRVMPMPIQLRDARQIETFIGLLRNDAPSLVVLDTWARVTVGLKENDASEQGLAIESVGRLQRALSCAVLAIHHTGKVEDAGPRGSSALVGAADVVIEARREKGSRTVRLMMTKSKDSEERAPVSLRSRVIDLGDGASSLVLDEDYQSSDSGLSPAAREMLGVFQRDFVETGATATEIRAACEGISHGTFFRARGELLRMKILQCASPGKKGARYHLSPAWHGEGQDEPAGSNGQKTDNGKSAHENELSFTGENW